MRPAASKPSRIGRPRSEAATSHAAIMDAVYELVQERSARDLTMEAVATRAGVGKPTLYKWWPSKAALILAMFHERWARPSAPPTASSVEAVLRTKMRRMIEQFNGLFGKVMIDLIAEGQHEPDILRELYDRHIKLRRITAAADIERGKATGEIAETVDSDLIAETLFAPIYYRLLLGLLPVPQTYGERLIDHAMKGLSPAVLPSEKPMPRT